MNQANGCHNSPAMEVGENFATTKKMYRKPTFASEVIFETMALACGKLAGTQGQCHVSRKLS